MPKIVKNKHFKSILASDIVPATIFSKNNILLEIQQLADRVERLEMMYESMCQTKK